MHQVMIDIETLSLTPNAVILSIGAVYLDSALDFYVEVAIESQKYRHIEPSTLKWWANQSMPVPLKGLVSIKDALELFSAFITGADEFWAKGPQFDFAVLEHAFAEYGISNPWKYNQVRDLRTLKGLYPDKIWAPNPSEHNALADAKYQAAILQQLLGEIHGTTGNSTVS